MPKRRTARSKTKVNKKTKSKINKILIMVSVLFVSTIILVGYGFIKFVKKDLALAFTTFDVAFSDNDFPMLSYVVVEDINAEPLVLTGLNFLIFDTKTKKLINYNVPVEQTLDIPGKYGTESLSKLLALGSLDSSKNLNNGIKLIENSLFKLFALKPQRYIIVDESFKNPTSEFLSTGNIVAMLADKRIKNIGSGINTNLSIQEIMNLSGFIKSLPEGRILSKNFETAYIDNTEMLDEEMSDVTFESAIALEKKNIAILNGSNTSGIAGFGSRVMKNVGGRVVGVSNASTTYDRSVLIVDDMESKTVAYIADVFGIKDIVLKSDSGDKYKESEIDRSDIILIIGLDIAYELY